MAVKDTLNFFSLFPHCSQSRIVIREFSQCQMHAYRIIITNIERVAGSAREWLAVQESGWQCKRVTSSAREWLAVAKRVASIYS